MSTPAPAQVSLPAPRQKGRSRPSPQLRLPGATSVDLVIVAVVIAGVRVRVRDCLGTTTKAQARTALLMGGTVEFARVHTTADGVEVVEVQGEARP